MKIANFRLPIGDLLCPLVSKLGDLQLAIGNH